jgi:tetratricopeptide (TPR) repeat protein
MSTFAPEFHKLSTRRLKVIEDNLPIREATTPLLLLNRPANMLDREVTLEEAMSAPPDVLGLSYLEATSVLQFCSIAKKGAKVSCEIDGIPLALNESNATLAEELLKKRQKVYQEAIQKRGSAKLSPGYQSEIEGGCAEWGISNERVLVEQKGFDIHLSQGSVRHAGVVVESTVAFRHDENISIYITGEIIGENIVFTTPVRYGLTGNAVERCTATLAPQEVVGPDWSRAFGGRAIAHYMYRKYGAVVTDLKRAIALDSNESSNWILLAYLLATCPDDNVRNGKEAVEAALNAKKLVSEDSNDVILVLLAVAYAEYGDFESAVKYQKMVIEKVDENTKPMHVERLQLFESKKPFRAEFPF